MGLTEQGYDLSFSHEKEQIAQTDAYGAMLVDGIYQGISKVQIGITGLEWTQGLLTAVTPYGPMAVSGATGLSPGVVGRRDSDVAGGIVLTATASTPAASAPATLTAPYAIVAKGFDVNWAYNSKLRKIAARWDVLMYLDDDESPAFLSAT